MSSITSLSQIPSNYHCHRRIYIGIFGPTNQIECVWSVIKRHIRRVHRVLAFSHEELALILKEWEMRHNRPDLFYNVDNYLFTCSGLLH